MTRTTPLLTVLGLGLLAFSSHAAIVFDHSPLQPNAVVSGSFASISNDQQIGDIASFTTDVSLGGMDTYVLDNAPINVGDTVRVRIFNDNAGTPVFATPFAEFDELVAIKDFDGSAGLINSGTTVSRVHVDFTNTVDLLANTTYWFSMSGVGFAFSQLTVTGLVDGNNHSKFVNGPFTNQNIGSDMAFRLYDTQAANASVPVPAPLGILLLGLVGMGISRRPIQAA